MNVLCVQWCTVDTSIHLQFFTNQHMSLRYLSGCRAIKAHIFIDNKYNVYILEHKYFLHNTYFFRQIFFIQYIYIYIFSPQIYFLVHKYFFSLQIYFSPQIYIFCQQIYEPRSDRRDLLATKVNSQIFTEEERPSNCEQLPKI